MGNTRSSHTSLWVWERALAPRGKSFTNAKLQRHRATTSYPTNYKEKSENASCAAQTRNKYLPGHHWPMQCLPIIAWKCNNAYCSGSSQLVPITPTPPIPICVALPKKVLRTQGVLLQIGAKDLTVTCVIQEYRY